MLADSTVSTWGFAEGGIPCFWLVTHFGAEAIRASLFGDDASDAAGSVFVLVALEGVCDVGI